MIKFKKILIYFAGVILIAVLGFFVYASQYYHGDSLAISTFQNSKNIIIKDDYIIFLASEPGDVGLVFYPGAKVEPIAYSPIMEKLAVEGITCVLVKMPFNMAIFNWDAAEKVYEKIPEVKNWFVGGHSMGGAMASKYASENEDKIEGLVLLGAYIYGEYPQENALTIYGSLNSNIEKNINYSKNIVVIEGGNHAQFGNYGKQKGDLPATITWEEQQNIAVQEIKKFISNKGY